MRGFKIGHEVSVETRRKIGIANDGNFFGKCDYCGSKYHTRKSHYVKSKRHFCCRDCYSKYRSEFLPKEEQPSFGTGYNASERENRRKAREIFNHYIRDKHIQRKPCEICGEKAEAHHDDYSKPLDVRWLCLKHHREWHKIHDNQNLMKEIIK